MAKAAKKSYYWDTCCFIAWITGKGCAREVLDGLEDIAREVTENRASLFTSVITETEILEGKLTAEEVAKFQNLFKRRNVHQITLDHRIARKASEIRNHYNAKGVKIKTPDAQHLATALIYEADEFHTMDGSGERQRPSDLLRLNGDVAGSPLHIRMPVANVPPLLRMAAAAAPIQEAVGGAIAENTRQEVEPVAVEIQGGGERHPKDQAAQGQGEDPPEEEKIEEPPSL